MIDTLNNAKNILNRIVSISAKLIINDLTWSSLEIAKKSTVNYRYGNSAVTLFLRKSILSYHFENFSCHGDFIYFMSHNS